MDLKLYYQSINSELKSLEMKIRNLMGGAHWLTDGEWKESILRNVLRKYLPETIKIGRGFIYTKDKCSSQIDILLYDNSYPILFKDGDLVFITPDAVRGIIEVKSNTNRTTLPVALKKLADNAELVNKSNLNSVKIFVGLFSYGNENVNKKYLLEQLKEASNHLSTRVVTHVCLNESIFARFWSISPQAEKNLWHTYFLQDLAPAYFITNILESVSPTSINKNGSIWFPVEDKEIYKTEKMKLIE